MNQKAKGIIGILTGGGDVPGLNPAIRAVTIRALREGYKVIGIRRGWKGLVDVIRDKKVDNSCNYFELTEERRYFFTFIPDTCFACPPISRSRTSEGQIQCRNKRFNP